MKKPKYWRWMIIDPDGCPVFRTAEFSRNSAIAEHTGGQPTYWKWREYYRQGYRARRVVCEVKE